MMRILMFVRILSLIRLARVSRLVRFFNEVEKVSEHALQRSPCEIQSTSLLPTRHLIRPGSSGADAVGVWAQKCMCLGLGHFYNIHENEAQYVRTNVEFK